MVVAPSAPPSPSSPSPSVSSPCSPASLIFLRSSRYIIGHARVFLSSPRRPCPSALPLLSLSCTSSPQRARIPWGRFASARRQQRAEFGFAGLLGFWVRSGLRRSPWRLAPPLCCLPPQAPAVSTSLLAVLKLAPAVSAVEPVEPRPPLLDLVLALLVATVSMVLDCAPLSSLLRASLCARRGCCLLRLCTRPYR
ncbi:uncharacterized protein LOC100280044 [Zea mays]|jgi:hypothetical protein|uniref:Uncharacterized protein n=1 Tax=Zea mays TaxID=4577 RepID=B8A1J1_MAIZE|nr:uncharacterized protein LOC100280044 [Zea mays]ACL54040.1 unknown [Zea mays]|eukprot:NP_001146457.1 uncharacterized protein LOC100280044 [Zea mays]